MQKGGAYQASKKTALNKCFYSRSEKPVNIGNEYAALGKIILSTSISDTS
jgi:hypothetical protein